jgi:hypothetical protein
VKDFKYIGIIFLTLGMASCVAEDPEVIQEDFSTVEQAQCGNTNLSVQQGEFGYLDSYVEASGEAYGPIAGRGQLVRNGDGTTTGSVSVAGLPPSTFFGSHLHRAACAEGAGAHMQDPAECPLDDEGNNSCVATFPGNELWFGGTTDASGRLVVQNTADWFIPRRDGTQRAKNLSIVIHDTPNNGGAGAGPKMLCVDLPLDRKTVGEIGFVTSGLTEDDRSESVVLKKARIKRNADGSTTATLKWKGLRPNFKYPSHIHAARCTEVSNGGPHYVRDIDCIGNEGGEGCPATAETEFWVGGNSNNKGKMNVQTIIPHLARAGALSLILHECLDSNGDPDSTGQCAGGKPRFVCVDFY